MASKAKTSDTENKSVVVLKGATDLQRLKLEKLMKNPNKEAFIPEKSKTKEPRAPHEFIRNVWGSSAGAGSGDFHVYRGVRRREYARQKFIDEMAEKTGKDEEYLKKVEQNQKAAEERTAKKRAKRNKKKQKLKAKKSKTSADQSKNEENDDTEESEDSEEEKVEEKTESDKGQTCDKVQLSTGQGGQDGNGEDEDR
uniref:PRKR-interacting protein 1 homolog n=1 Tax=Crassostrea virginica TaxID=6565 RepID=A0A8B8EXM1_CRAVI|nr:PRKR-interacting protein 1 homolog [Crassostrea virginica]